MHYIINSQSIILFLNGKPVKVSKDTPIYASIIKAFRLPEADQEAAILAALDKQNVNKNIEDKGFVINGEEVVFEGEKLPAPLAQKIVSMIRENLPVELFKNFWRNLKLNPSSSSVTELYDFLSYKELPITEDGCFLAYKGVKNDYYSVQGNTSTVVLKGKVDKTGHIYNGVGEVIEVRRNCVDDNRANTCSYGVHAGSLDYANGWGQRRVVVKINPKDVVSVPKDYSCQKLRCCGYTVIQDLVEEIVVPVVSEDNKPVINKFFKKDMAEQSYIQKRVKNYLDKWRDDGDYDSILLSKVRNIFSPKYPDKKEIISAAQAVGYRWGHDVDGTELIWLD